MHIYFAALAQLIFLCASVAGSGNNNFQCLGMPDSDCETLTSTFGNQCTGEVNNSCGKGQLQGLNLLTADGCPSILEQNALVAKDCAVVG